MAANNFKVIKNFMRKLLMIKGCKLRDFLVVSIAMKVLLFINFARDSDQ